MRTASCLWLLAAASIPRASRADSGQQAEDAALQRAVAGHCQMMATSGYGYRQFIPLELVLSPASGDDPMAGYPAPPGALPAPTPPPRLVNESGAGPGTTAKPPAATNATRLLIRFQVMAESDAHILLAAERRSDRDAYEVVLGAGNNTYTDFRRLPASLPPRRAFNYSEGVVSGGELRDFWILVDLRTGVLAVGPDGAPPVLAWVDPDPVRIKYLSLCTWTDVRGVWLYGCGRTGHAALLDAEWMSPSQRVRQHVLAANAKASPHVEKGVSVTVHAERLRMDDGDGVLSIFGSLHLEWRDERLAWQPEDYSDTLDVVVSPSEVWVPALHTAGPSWDSPAAGLWNVPDSMVNLTSSANLKGQFPVHLRARCSLADTEQFIYKCEADVTSSPPACVTTGSFEQVRPEKTFGRDAEWEVVGFGLSSSLNCDLSLNVHVRYQGSRITCIFLATYIAALTFWTAGLFLPEPSLRCLQTLHAWRPPPQPRTRTLLFALVVLDSAVLLLSNMPALPPALLYAGSHDVTCLSAALSVSALALVAPAFLLPSSGPPPPLPPSLARIVRSAAFSRALLCRTRPPDEHRWRDGPLGEAGVTAEQVLERLDAIEAQMTRSDWVMLAVSVEKVGALVCILLAVAALVSNVANWRSVSN